MINLKSYNIQTTSCIDMYYYEDDSDLPDSPKLDIYKETLFSFKNITEKWYKENG